jgi:selenide, water dikinase
LLPGALDAVRAGMIPGGLKNNREFVGTCVAFEDNVPEEIRSILFDPQTSGGLLIALAPDMEETALQFIQKYGAHATRVGRVLEKTSPLLHVL